MDTEVLCRCCNTVNDIAVLVCECGQDLTFMTSSARRSEVLAARERGEAAMPTDNQMWEDRPDDSSMDGNPFDTLKCCEKETLCILGSGEFEGQCRSCGEKIKVRLS